MTKNLTFILTATSLQRKLIIIEINPSFLDGTLALNDHRKHFISDGNNQRWDDFYRACVEDKPNKSVIDLFDALYCAYDNDDDRLHDLIIFSGRSDLVKSETVNWLCSHTILDQLDFATGWCKRIELKMRAHGDYTLDKILKRKWYEELSQEDKNRVVCVFDDRQKVVDMWRSIGVTCLQVAKGDF